MKHQSEANKNAWSYKSYDFWVKELGLPSQAAKDMLKQPDKYLRRHGKSKGQLTDRFLSIGEDYIFSITKAVWIIDKNHLYSRVNTLRIDKKRKILVNDDGKTKPLSYEKEIFN